MAPRKTKDNPTPSEPKARDARYVLVAHPSKTRREAVMNALCAAGHSCIGAPSAAAACEALTNHIVVAAVVAEIMIPAIRANAGQHALPGFVMLTPKPDLAAAKRALGLGACDLLDERCESDELHASIEKAMQPATKATAREERLEKLCKRLNESRRTLSKELNRLCADMTSAYSELAQQIDTVAIAGEFTGLIRQELELESLMRTSLEFLLAKLGSTNAALFLPSSSGEWTLGAYVNYDRSKDSAEMMLDHLADTVPERLEELGSTVRFDTQPELAANLPGASEWIDDCAVVGFSAAHEGETLASVLLFRDRSTPFPAHTKQTLDALSKILASQFARVIRVHHRHLPKEQWASPGDPLPPQSSEEGFFESTDEDELL
ncbi:MAG: hypothetical protein K2Y21_02730 [Phycisphaerales bacterium]|nr:hypothetical protein [Phycisphaerales bacterium]